MADDDRLALCAAERETDIGNGRRFRLRHGDLAGEGRGRALSVIHVGWHVFDGMRWKEDEGDRLVRRLAHDTAVRIADEPKFVKASPAEAEAIEAGEAAAEALIRLAAVAEPDEATKAEKKALSAAVAAAEKARKDVADRRKGRARHAKSSAGSAKISNMLIEAAPYVSAVVDDLNRDRMAVNCLSGTIEFAMVEDEDSDPAAPRFRPTATLRPHDPADMMTKCCHAHWSPPEGLRPPTPVFDGFLAKVIPDPEQRAFLKRWFGYCLTGDISEQALLFFHGEGRNGKSTLNDLMAFIFGDYAVTLSIDSFTGDNKRGGGEATPDLARLPGARLVLASEPEQGVKLKDALIKAMTGGEKMPVRRLHRDFFEIDPHFKVVISGNHEPRITDDSDGIWRRVKKVEWGVQIAKAEIDKGLLKKLKREADGVFAWAVEGALEWMADGLAVPESVDKATQDYRDNQDEIGAFIRVAIDVTGTFDHTETPGELYRAFERVADAEGLFKINNSTFDKRLAKASARSFAAADGTMRRFAKSKSNGASLYRGLIIRDQWRAQNPPETYGGYKR